MSHKEYFKIVGKAKAYQGMTCANGWADPARKHTVSTGETVVRAEVAKADRSVRVNYYCEACANLLLAEREDVLASQEHLRV